MRLALCIFALVLAGLPAPNALSMPVRPDLLQKLSEDDRLDEAREAPSGDLMLMVGDGQPGTVAPPSGTIRALVLLVDFSDQPADTILHDGAWFERMLFDPTNPGSMTNYYLANSYGKLSVTGEIRGWFRLPQTMTYYADYRRGMGYYPKNAQKMIEDAVAAADGAVDFSEFDNDGPDGVPASGDDDGVVDYLLVVHAGHGYEWTLNREHIHSHAGAIRGETVDGVRVIFYATEPEDGRVGTFAHELGHLVGLPDLYDVRLSSFGLGMWSLMAYGSWGGGDGSAPVGLDAWSKVKLGFVAPDTVSENITDFALPCVEEQPVVVRLWSEGRGGSEYFLIENRKATSYDSYLAFVGEGLLVYHIDERFKDNSGDGGQLVYLEQADGRYDLDQPRYFGFGSDRGDPFPGWTANRAFSWNTTPGNLSSEGVPTEVSIRDISDPGGTMWCDVEVTSPVILFDDYLVSDPGGDGDGEPDPGEEVVLKLRLRNHGAASSDLTVSLSTSDPLITLLAPSAQLGSLGAEAYSSYLEFPMVVDASTPQPHNVQFTVSIAGLFAGGSYQSDDRFVLGVPLSRLAGWPVATGNVIYSSPSVADLDGDGTKDIVLGNHNGRVFAWKADGSLLPGWPAFVGTRTTSKPAICDINVDGSPEIIVTSQEGKIHVLRADGTRLPGWPQAVGGMVVSSVALGDMDDDGVVEIVCGAKDGKVYAWNEDASPVPGWPVEIGGREIWMSPAIADCDGDYAPEVVIGGYGGKLYIFEGDGAVLKGWPVLFGWGCGSGSPAIADLDGDGSLEIAVSGLFSNSIYVVGADGSVKGGWPRWAYNCTSLSSPVVADIDNDGLPEVAVSTSCGTIVAWDANGSKCDAIKAAASDPIEYCEPVFADLDGDGDVEGLFGTSGSGQNHVYAFDNEGVVTGFPVEVSGGVWATPCVDDLDGDGYAEIILATTAGEAYVWRFMGAKTAGRTEWSQSRGDLWNTGYYRYQPHDNIPLADLVVTAADVSFEPEKPKQGDGLEIKVRVANVGHAAADQVEVDLYRDAVDDSLLIASATILHLAPKSENDVSVAWRVPGGEPTRLVYARIDRQDKVLERSELNNLASQRFYLSVPDLSVAVDSIEPFPVVIGDSLTVHATLRNLGADVARRFAVSFYDSLVTDSRCFATIGVDSLGLGETADLSARYLVTGFQDDFLDLWCAADPAEAVLEYHLSNNAARFSVSSGIQGELVVMPPQIQATDFRFSRTGIVYDAATSPIVIVALAKPPYDAVFGIDGSGVDISRNACVFGARGDIAGFDMQERSSFVVSATEEQEYQPAIWGENIVWVAEGPESTALKLRRGPEPARTIRMAGPGAIARPDISHRIVVWEERGPVDYDVWGYDLEADTCFVVSEGPGDQINPCVSGSMIVWEDHYRDGGDILAFDRARGQVVEVAVTTGSQRHPDVSNDLVVWQDSRGGNWDVYGYSLAAGEEFPISRQIGPQTLPRLTDSTVMWIDQRSNVNRIIGLRFGGNQMVASVRRFEALSQDALIRVSVNIDEYEDGVSYRIYRYSDYKWDREEQVPKVREYFTLADDSLHVYEDTLVFERRSYFYKLGIVDGYGEETVSDEVSGQAFRRSPKSFVVGSPVPNPFVHEVDVSFGLPRLVGQRDNHSWPDPSTEISDVAVQVYGVTGQLVRTLKTATLTPGYYRVSWDGRNQRGVRVSAGVYYIGVSAGRSFAARKVILLR